MRISLPVLAAGALLVPAAASTAQTSQQLCGRLHQGFETKIVARDMSCGKARTIVDAWHRRAVTESQGPRSRTIGSFRCVSHTTDPEHVRVRCTYRKDPSEWVNFHAGP